MLRRFTRDCAVLGVLAAVGMLIARGGRPDGALGVAVGAGCMAFSYRVIRQSLDARARRAVDAAAGQAPDSDRSVMAAAWALTKYVTRWGVIALVVWAALVPLHALPAGLFLGVTVPVAAIGLEAFRMARNPGRT